jgi:hypothetical protein
MLGPDDGDDAHAAALTSNNDRQNRRMDGLGKMSMGID